MLSDIFSAVIFISWALTLICSVEAATLADWADDSSDPAASWEDISDRFSEEPVRIEALSWIC